MEFSLNYRYKGTSKQLTEIKRQTNLFCCEVYVFLFLLFLLFLLILSVPVDLWGLHYFCQSPYYVPPKHRTLSSASSPPYEFQSDSCSSTLLFRADRTKAGMSRRPWKAHRQNCDSKPEGHRRGGGLFGGKLLFSLSFSFLSRLFLFHSLPKIWLFSTPLQQLEDFLPFSTNLSQRDVSDLRFCCCCVVIRQHRRSHCSH